MISEGAADLLKDHPATDDFDLTIVIVSYNTHDLLRNCLIALPQSTIGLKCEVWVVDNNSPDESALMVAAEFPDVHLIANTNNPGFARANNQAIRQSRSRHVLLLNPDTIALPSSLTMLAEYLDGNPNIGAAGPKLLNSDGSLQPNGRRFPTVMREFIMTTGLYTLLNSNQKSAFDRAEFMRADFDMTSEVDQVSGACLMMRGSAIKEIGLLDESFFMFYEETEWCWRLKRAGYKVAYVGDSSVIHHWMGSVRQLGRASAAYLRASARLYYRKTGGPIAVLGISLVLMLAAVRTELLHLGAAAKRQLRAMK